MSHVRWAFARQNTRRPHRWNRLHLELLEDRAVPSILYDESMSGDLSNDPLAPTPVTTAVGTNSVLGTVGGGGNQDWITFRIPAGTRLDSLVLARYTSTDGQGFLGVQDGPTFEGSTTVPGSYLGYAHFGTSATNGNLPPANLVGADLLPLMGDTGIAFGSQGFTPPLPAGDYTFLIQQLGASTTYQFDFNTSVAPAADLVVDMSHAGDFTRGDADVTYTVTVSNTGTAATSGTVTVTDLLPTGLTPSAANTGVVNGWNLSFEGQTISATRSDPLGVSASYPPLVLTVDVANDAPASLVNTATVAGGGEVNTANNTDDDPTTILPYTVPNQPPVNTLPGAFATNEDESVALAGISFTDPDARNGTERVTFSVPTGTLALNTGVVGGVTAAQVTGNGTGTVIVTAKPVAINATLTHMTGLIFTPALNLFGDVLLTMDTNDLGNLGPGGQLTDQDFATIAVAPVNDAPTIATNAGLRLDRGTTVAITTAALAAADVDNTAAQLTFAVTTGPAHGAVLLSGAPTTTFTQADLIAGQVSYQHDNSPGTTDAFIVTVSDGSLSAAPATFNVDINSIPLVTTDPTPQAGFAGTRVTFTAAADGSPTPTVRWQESTDGGATFTDIAGATSPTLTIRIDAAKNGARYRAVFTNTAGEATSAAAALAVTPGLALLADPAPQTAAVGTMVTFTAAAEGTKKPRAQWQVSTDGGATFVNLPGAVGVKLRVKVLATVDGNLYRAVFTNVAGSAATTAAGLTADYSVTVAGMRRPLIVPVGADVSLTGSVRGLTAPTVQWEVSTDKGKTYTPVPGATAATLTFTAAAGDTGKYFRAVFTAGTKVRRTGPVVLTVGTAPAVTTPPASTTVAAGQTATFSVAIAGTPVVKVQWQVSTDGGKTFTNVRGQMKTTLTLRNVKPTLNGNLYRVMLTSPFDQVVSLAAVLTVS